MSLVGHQGSVEVVKGIDKAKGDRRGGYRSNFSSFLDGEKGKPIKERDLTPKLRKLNWKKNMAWRAEFRALVEPYRHGVDANTIFGEHTRHNAFKRIDCPSMMAMENAEEVDETLTLHPMDHVGIDTCSALSVSSEVADFLYLDDSEEARNSVSLNGVSEGGPEVLARGPMLVSTLDTEGRQTFLVDPFGVLVASSSKQARLRIYGQQRMKKFGFHIIQSYSEGSDLLNYKDPVKYPFDHDEWDPHGENSPVGS